MITHDGTSRGRGTLFSIMLVAGGMSFAIPIHAEINSGIQADTARTEALIQEEVVVTGKRIPADPEPMVLEEVWRVPESSKQRLEQGVHFGYDPFLSEMEDQGDIRTSQDRLRDPQPVTVIRGNF